MNILNKVNKLIFASILAASFILAAGIAPVVADTQDHNVITGASILVYVGDAYHNEPNNFANVYNSSGNAVTVATSYDFASDLSTDNFDAILFSNLNSNMTVANMTAIKTWYELGNKLMWVAGDSDYGGFYIAGNFANPMLEMVKSQLRMDAGALADSQSNDAASYRVIANETGISSNVTDYVTAGFKLAPFHGPTSVFGWDYANSTGVDLRNTTLPNVNVIVNSSAAATALDQDTSITVADFYEYSNVTGNYPLMASEKLNGSYVVVTGEVNFDDYKFMYGMFTEKNQLAHQGMMLVDNMISWVFYKDFGTKTMVHVVLATQTETMTETETETLTENTTISTTSTVSTTLTSTVSTPFALYAPLLAISFLGIAALVYRKRN